MTDPLLIPGSKEANKTDIAPVIAEPSVEQKIKRVMQEGPEDRVSIVCPGH